MMDATEKTKEWLMKQLKKEKVEETPYDVANGSRGWDQADYTPGIDQLANDIGIMEAELRDQPAEKESEPEPIFDNPYDDAEDVADDNPEVVEPRKMNRHERRKRAKLARMFAMKEKLENERKKK